MSELIVTEKTVRVQLGLMTSVSVLALLGNALFGVAAAGERSDPAIWIDIGGQFEIVSDPQGRWNPDYFSGADAGPLVGTFSNAQKPPRVGYDINIGGSFHPSDSDWFVSASAHIGRARRHVNDLKQDKIQTWIFGVNYPTSYGEKVYTTESHRIVDFKVGKDVGIGLSGISTSFDVGVRFANMRSRADTHLSSNFAFPVPFYGYFVTGSVINRAENLVSHEFNGVGPLVEWRGSLPVTGETEGGKLSIDAGASASVLFGRQLTERTVDGYYWRRQFYVSQFVFMSHAQNAHNVGQRHRNATVPNLGGFIAASYRLPNVKVSLGYRADMYFNAVDGGVSSFKSEDRGFFGPYFNLSVGLGG